MEFDAGGEPRRPGCNAFGQGISAPDVVEAGDYGALSVTEYEATAIELLPQEPGHISGELVAQNVQYSFEQNDAPLGGSRVTLTGRKRH